VVDDLIPTEELADGRPVPLFARCANHNLFWVSLIEKAYAKLHSRYFSLQGGTTDEALEDLLGTSVENCFIDHDMTDPTALTVTLQTLCANHCVVGLKIDVEMFAANK
jgi:Calpain family cysteine protease